MSRTRRDHAEALASLGLAAGVEPLAVYLDLLAEWNRRANLTGAHTPAARATTLIAPVLALAPLLKPGRLIDVGSGNGSPGLVLAILRPELQVTLLEPRRKRWAFLRDAARAVGRRDIDVQRCRHDEYQGLPARNVTLRALTLDLEGLAPLVSVGGQLLVLGVCPVPGTGFRREDPPEPSRQDLNRFRRI